MAKHKDFTVATDVKVYFCDPQSPWQRGTNENTNLLLRQYFPRGTDLSGYSQEQLDQVSLLLNQRPRKTLGFQTPADKLQASVASTSELAAVTGHVPGDQDSDLSGNAYRNRAQSTPRGSG
jgi:IS30 family transposase